MTNWGQELSEALAAGNRPRLIDAIRKLRELLATVDLDRVAELLKGLLQLLDQVGLLPATSAAAAELDLEAACRAACADEATVSAQAIDFASLLAVVKLIVELVRRFRPA